MKTLPLLKRLILAGVIALTIGLALAPRAQASASPNSSIQTEQVLPLAGGKDGEETHG